MTTTIDNPRTIAKDFYDKLFQASGHNKEIIRAEFSAWFGRLSQKNQEEVRGFWDDLFRGVSNDLEKLESKVSEIADATLIIMGKEYPLSEWLTIATYSKKYDKSPARILNWIKRGIIGSDCVIVVPGLNHLKLVSFFGCFCNASFRFNGPECCQTDKCILTVFIITKSKTGSAGSTLGTVSII
jgi:hypothetical protein